MKIYPVLFCMLFFCAGCVYPFDPKNIDEMENLLIIEGDIIANGTTIVKLSRSVKLTAEGSSVPVEPNARVKIESSTGIIYPATETSPGTYEAATSALDLSAKYRLHVTTRDNNSYASDFVSVCISPPIDSISYVVNNEAQYISIRVSTHDPANNTHYYKWSYEQDWEFMSVYLTDVIYDPTKKQYLPLPYDSNIFYCWNKQPSSSILVDNSLKLSKDVIANKQLLTITAGDQRISYLYCIQVLQKALTAEAYNYWENLFKNSEDMGGIFSPQPSELRGNIVCLSQPEQPVLGYISASTQALSERLFIKSMFFKPTDWSCVNLIDTLSIFEQKAADASYASGKQPFIYDNDLEMKAYWAPRNCVDCTSRGTKKKPSWWPNSHQ